MKKIMMMALAICAFGGFAAKGECVWSWWAGSPAENVDKEISGCALGLASEFKSVRGAQVSVCMNRAGEVKSGCQGAIGYNETGTLRNGCQVAFVNRADSAALQIGLLCFNKGGFLPFFVFFNFDKTGFGGKR